MFANRFKKNSLPIGLTGGNFTALKPAQNDGIRNF